MKSFGRAIVAIATATVLSGASADVVFSNVVVGGSLGAGVTHIVSPTDIDFFFTNAIVGDVVAPLRSGDITISFEAESALAVEQEAIQLNLLGALNGSGLLTFDEIVEDLNIPGVIASHSVVLDHFSSVPHVALLDFDRPTTHVRVTKRIELSAEDTWDEDLAGVVLMEQKFREIPEPGAVWLIITGALLLRGRRSTVISARRARTTEDRKLSDGQRGLPARDMIGSLLLSACPQKE